MNNKSHRIRANVVRYAIVLERIERTRADES